MFVKTKEAIKELGVHPNTLRKWADEGKIKSIRSPSGQRLYDVEDFKQTSKTRRKFIYARVSTKRQSDELERQIKHLRARYPEHELIEDFGSGINFKRKGFNSLLEHILSGDVEEVVVAHRDRLCRFGFELVNTIASKHGTRIVVLDESSLSPEAELVRDLLSIVHIFSCRIYGFRKYNRQIKEDQDLPKVNE